MRRALLAAAALVLVLAPAASAKLRLWLDVTPTASAGRPVAVVLRSQHPLDWNLRLIAVAPGKDWYDVVGTVTGDSSLAHASIPRDGFEVPVARVGAKRWRAVVRFPRPGRWRLLVPNVAPRGFMIPPPVVRTVVVR